MSPRIDFSPQMKEALVSAFKQTLPDVDYNCGKFELASSEVDRATVVAAMLATKKWLVENVELIDSEVTRLSLLSQKDWNLEQVERARYNLTSALMLIPTVEELNEIYDKAAGIVQGV
ncbi:hypothetical protein [Serratia sp. Leaf51]|uniref:hypothetical protein n=1 Tax=Rahnella sp. PAMC 25559 TaxID=3423225 RepID=UPI0006FD16D0|nr:hypothetical protein ASE99_13360 [Serratia sp. Leaf51]